MKLLIAIPAQDHVFTAFSNSLNRLIRHLAWEHIEFETCYRTGSLVYDSREQLAARARLEGFDHVLWLDTDMVFPADVYEQLLAHNKDFVTGICHARKPPFRSAIYDRLLPDPVLFKRTTYPDSLFEIAGSGLACALTSTKLLSDVKKEFGALFVPNLAFGEDLAFCVKAADLGYKLYADPKCIIKHIGYREIGPEDEIIG